MGENTLLKRKTKFSRYILYNHINNKDFYFIVLFKFGSHVINTVNSEIIYSKCHKKTLLRHMPAKYPGRRRATSRSMSVITSSLIDECLFLLFPSHILLV